MKTRKFCPSFTSRCAVMSSSGSWRLFHQLDFSSLITSNLYWNSLSNRLFHAFQKPQFAAATFSALRLSSPTNFTPSVANRTPPEQLVGRGRLPGSLGPRWFLAPPSSLHFNHAAYFCTSCSHFRHFHVEPHHDRRRMLSKSVEGRARPLNDPADPEVSSSHPTQTASVSKDETLLDPRNEEADKYYAFLEKTFPKTKVRERIPSIAEDQLRQESVGTVGSPEDEGEKKVSLWMKFKDMYKKYWYVLIPVHGALCVTWFGGFYFLASRGVDVIPLLEKLGVSETLIGYARRTGAGHLAAAFAMYKLASPLRYSVTVGATTVAINYLTKYGYIKPVPTAAKLKEMIKDRGEQLKVLSRRGRRRLTRIRDRYRKERFVPNGKNAKRDD